jgi:hypothetical protein
MRSLLSAPRYLAAAALTAVGCFVLVWAWVATMPLAYLDPEYPAWQAKLDLLQRCDLGEVLLLGDSRAAADVIPEALPVITTNLAVGGGKPIEAYVALSRALRCPVRPRRVLISLSVIDFMQPDLFWERSVRFGFLNAAELSDFTRVAHALGDWPVFRGQQSDGLPDRLRGRLYDLRFPPLYFNSLLKGGVFLRWWQNTRSLQAALDERGHYYFGTDAGSSIVAVDAHLPVFQPLAVLDWYFDRLLALLAERNIPVDFISMPLNHATAQQVRPEFRDAFHAYLASYEARYPGFHVVGPVMADWPDRWFGDGFSHLNPGGAARFSAILGRCLAERMAELAAAVSCEGEAFQLAERPGAPR